MAKAKKLPSGSWRVLVYDCTDQNGKRRYKSFTAETKKEAEYLAAEYTLKKKNKNDDIASNAISGNADRKLVNEKIRKNTAAIAVSHPSTEYTT